MAFTSGQAIFATGGDTTESKTAAAALIALGLTATAAELNALDGITASVTELNYVDGVTSAIQTQLNALAVVAIGVAVSDETSDLETGTAKLVFRMPYAMTLSAVRASVTTAPTGASLIVDINESGTTILSTALSIDATEKTSTTAATPAVISDTALADDAEITIDIDQVGSTIPGAGLKVWLVGVRS